MAEDSNPGYVLRSAGGKGEGVYATKDFKRNDLIIRGDVLEVAARNSPWATQVGVDR